VAPGALPGEVLGPCQVQPVPGAEPPGEVGPRPL